MGPYGHRSIWHNPILFWATALWLATASAAVSAATSSTGAWSHTLKAARHTTVHLFMYGGSQTTNHYVDDYVIPQLGQKRARSGTKRRR